MGKYKENTKNNIISIRITDEELKTLEHESHITNRNISELMREALHAIATSATVCHTNYDMGGNSI